MSFLDETGLARLWSKIKAKDEAIEDEIDAVKSNLTKINRQPITGSMNLSYNSSTQLMGDLDLSSYDTPTPPVFMVLVVSGTPFGQITRCLVGALGNNKYRLYVQGNGFVNGHVLQIIWYSSEKVN